MEMKHIEKESAAPIVAGSKENPANAPVKTLAERKRVPMNVPVQTLETPDIPGYHLHWFRNSPGRIERAKLAGYELILRDELSTNNVSIGGNSAVSGSTDMGAYISVVSGEGSTDGQPNRLVLMKIKEEWFEESQKLLEEQNENVAAALRGDGFAADNMGGDLNPGDTSHRYEKQNRRIVPDFFKRKLNRSANG